MDITDKVSAELEKRKASPALEPTPEQMWEAKNPKFQSAASSEEFWEKKIHIHFPYIIKAYGSISKIPNNESGDNKLSNEALFKQLYMQEYGHISPDQRKYLSMIKEGRLDLLRQEVEKIDLKTLLGDGQYKDFEIYHTYKNAIDWAAEKNFQDINNFIYELIVQRQFCMTARHQQQASFAYTQLYYAIRCKQPLEVIISLIASLPEPATIIHQPDLVGKTLFRIGVRSGDPEIIKALLPLCNNEVINKKDLHEESHIHAAVITGNPDVVLLLLDKLADINTIDAILRTPLMRAVGLGHIRVAELLMSRNPDLTKRNYDGRTVLHDSVANQEMNEITKQIIEKNPALVLQEDNSKNIPLFYAAKTNNLPAISMLVEEMKKAKNKDNEAAISKHLAKAAIMILKHAKKSFTTPQRKLITEDSGFYESDAFNSLLKLIQNKSDLNYQDEELMTLLHHASAAGAVNLAKILLNSEAEIDNRDRNNKTALHYACANADEEMAGLLTKYRANINLCDGQNLSPLHYAVSSMSLKLIGLLLNSKEPKVDALNMGPDKSGKLPIYIAIEKANESGNLAIVHLLLQTNDDIGIKNRYGQSVTDLLPKITHSKLHNLIYGYLALNELQRTLNDPNLSTGWSLSFGASKEEKLNAIKAYKQYLILGHESMLRDHESALNSNDLKAVIDKIKSATPARQPAAVISP